MGGMPHRRWIALILVCVLAAASGCAGIISGATSKLASSLSAGILNQDDPETVRDGLPAYLLLLDGFLQGDPKNESLLAAGAKLYGAYAGQFVQDPGRAARMTDKALDYGLGALCGRRPAICAARTGEFAPFEAAVGATNKEDVPALYAAGATWAGWIQAHASDLDAVADIPRVKVLVERVAKLDETYDRGGAFMYLGVIDTLIPPAYGGKPEEGRREFERAIELSKGRNLMAKVLFAKSYARLVFDRELHDRLLGEVLAADPKEPDLTLVNVLAQREAKALLASAEQFF